MGELQEMTGNQLSILDDQITAVNDALRPASDDAIAAAIIKLAGAGLAFPTGIKPEGAARVYQFALRGISIAALKSTVIKIIQGEYPNSQEFIPKPPMLAAYARAAARELWNDRERLISIKEAREFKLPNRQRSEEEIARVRALVEQVKAAAVANREAEKSAFYDKPEAELNRIFMNKVDPPEPPPPGAGKWDDDRWFSQQKENENGKETVRHESEDRADASGEPDGRGNGDEGGGGIFGFEDGGE